MLFTKKLELLLQTESHPLSYLFRAEACSSWEKCCVFWLE